MAIFSRFFGNAVSTAAGTSIGQATGAAITPKLQQYANELWNEFPNLPIIAYALAEGVAQGQVPRAWAETEALNTGTNAERFSRLVDIANTGPGASVGLMLWRRGFTDEAGFRRAAKRQGLEQEWINDLVQTFHDLLDPADLARAIHRGLIPDPGLLRGTLPSGVGNVPAYPVYPIDAVAEARGSGYDKDRLGVLVGLQGLPMGSHEAAQALFRTVLTEDDYLRAIAEGNTRNEWADAIKEQSRAIPSVTNYVEARVRGWIDDAKMVAGAARHGMTPEDTQLEFLIHGRPLSWHQVFIGERRGGKYKGDPIPPDPEFPGIDPAFLKALKESNIRPEWYEIAWAQRFNYPAPFVLRALTSDADLEGYDGLSNQAAAERILLYQGWEPKLAATVSAKWATASPTKVDPAVKTAEGKFLTAIHKAFVGGAITDAQGVEQIALTSLSDAAQTGVLGYWRKERALERIPPPAAPAPPAA